MTTYAALPKAKAFRGQYQRTLVCPIPFANAQASGSAFTPVFQLPPGAIVTDGALVVSTAYNSTGSSTISLGTSAAPAAELAATSLKTAAVTAITAPAPTDGAGITLGYTLASVGGETAGNATIYLRVILPDGEDFSLGDDLQQTI